MSEAGQGDAHKKHHDIVQQIKDLYMRKGL